ncbi:MAG: NADH:ubiquinone oxidoreductase subunit [Candidatus Midichloriaceae bacterium]|jgi:NADH:ubiquinone oxidoreductase subunit|nr:NADH:ubiquinone oxidoreductase subunit [Candidatus Midichloriaceae bacterium]
MNKWINKLLISLKSNFMGADEFGNLYYESKRVDRTFGKKSRCVIYNGTIEASKVPAAWALWLHHQKDEAPKNNTKDYKWEKPHTPNLTGTDHAYFPPGHVLSRAQRDVATGDYESWQPK